MPQPLPAKFRGDISGGSHVLERRPHFAAKIGLVAAAWVGVEDSLGFLLGMTTGVVTPGDGMVRLERHPVAIAVMESLESMAARLTITEEALRLVRPKRLDEFKRLAQQVRRLSGARNEIVHGRWAETSKYPDELLREVRRGGYMRYTIRDFDEVLLRIHQLSGTLTAFMWSCKNDPEGIEAAERKLF